MADIIKNILKVDENTISYERVKPEETYMETYDITSLVSKRDNMIEEKAIFNTKIDAEIAKLNALINGAENAGITIPIL